MTRLALPALLGLAAVLACLAAAELLLPGPEQEALDQTGVRPVPRLPRVDTTREVAETVDHTGAWVEAILARPLFTRDRKPDSNPSSGPDTGPVAGPLPRLTGIAITPIGRRAIFAAPDGGGAPVVVGEGGIVAGYRVETIRPGIVRIRGPGGDRTVVTAFDPNPRSPQLETAGQPQFGQSQFGQSQFGQSQFGQPQFGQPGQPQFPQPGTPQFPQPGIPGQFVPGFPRVPGMPLPGRPRVGDGAWLEPSAPGTIPGSGAPRAMEPA